MQSLKTKIFTCLLSFVMAFSLIPAFNSNAAVIDAKAAITGSNLSWNLDSTGTLTITGTGAMPNFVYDKTAGTIKTPWFNNRSKIKKLVIGDGVSSVGDYAFACCPNLSEIVWPSNGSLKTIGNDSFAVCASLVNVTLPSGLTSIGKWAFEQDTKLETIALPNTLKTIGYGAFMDCRSLQKLSLPKSLVSIGDFAFHDCYNLVSVTGGAGLQTIGRQAFEFDTRLKTFTITSKKLKKIGVGAFRCCTSLKTISIKKTTKLTKKGVKGSLYLSSVKKVKVKKSKVKKYKKYFTYRNCGKRSVKVRK